MQRKQLADAVNEAAKDFFDNAPCGYLFTSPTGEILKINHTLLTWLGYAEEELIGVIKLRDLICGGGKIFYETHYAPLLMMQGFVNEINFVFCRKDGSTFPVLITSKQKKDEHNKPLFNSLVVIDYSDRKKYEKELIIAKKKAIASDEAKTVFLSTISHEILTPLNAIVNSANLLSNTSLTEEQRALSNLLVFSSKNLSSLLNDILFVSKSELGVYKLDEKDFSLAQVCRNLMYTYQNLIKEKELKLNWSIDDKIPEVLIGDAAKIIQVLSNLLNNAIKFTKKGTISLEIKLTKIHQNVARLFFAVSDTGIGMEEEDLKIIFDPFSQANQSINNQFGGSGLGLSICKDILMKYNSQIHVESKPGKGSTFTFYLALKISKNKIEEIQINEGPQEISDLKVLLVEDNETNAFLAGKYFKQWELAYDHAKSGKEAIEKVINNDYNLILMDLRMPDMDGYETTRLIRKLDNREKSQIPIVAFSAVENTTINKRMKDFQINGFVQKPFQPEVLYQAITKYSKTIKQQSPALPKHKTTPKNTTNKTHIDLSNLYETFDQEEDSVKDFIKILLPDFRESKAQTITAMTIKDLPLLRDAIHKLQSTISVLKADRLRKLLMECRQQLTEAPTENHQAVLDKTVQEMDLYIHKLENI